ncbi:hypothetical protein CLV24_105109 [Pontibacter ummariensis]|uniref:ParG protein n=1 Tax=Pontibacter ummariensis TaxID=1610492 RepID=A0A239DXH8_9BACT|nr:hypothetical protein [Pontibacter ummariensis]PRY13739.1 hypothetical protein CLV24_105109 [Pontibacter ummariensis]SNS36334.1 hypothetical protein SAMN06296052_105142 [Pontibacter ummariensis]
MAKDFKKNMPMSGGLSSLIGESNEEPTKRGRPKTSTKEVTKTSQEGTKESETRATFIVNEDLLEKCKAIAYWDRVLIKDVIGTALQEYVEKYEKKAGEIKPVPKK